MDCQRNWEFITFVCPQCLVRSVVLWSTWSETATPTQESLTMTVTTTNMWYVIAARPQNVKENELCVFCNVMWFIFCLCLQPFSLHPSIFPVRLVLLRPAPLQLEDLEVTVADHIQKVLKPNFAAAWEEVGDEFEKEETFALASVRTLDGTQNSRQKTWMHFSTKFSLSWIFSVHTRHKHNVSLLCVCVFASNCLEIYTTS